MVWRRYLAAYAVGLGLISAGLAVTLPLGVRTTLVILGKASSSARAERLLTPTVALSALLNGMPFFVGGMAVGWIVPRSGLLHGLVLAGVLAVFALFLRISLPGAEALPVSALARQVTVSAVCAGCGAAVSVEVKKRRRGGDARH